MLGAEAVEKFKKLSLEQLKEEAEEAKIRRQIAGTDKNAKGSNTPAYTSSGDSKPSDKSNTAAKTAGQIASNMSDLASQFASDMSLGECYCDSQTQYLVIEL